MSFFSLVHGSTQSPAGWNLLVPELHKRGHDAVCVDLPVNEHDAGATRYAEVIAESLSGSSEPAIIVAHSVSGLFPPLVCAYRPISRFVFIAAILPDLGKSLSRQFQKSPQMVQPNWVGKDPIKDHEVARQYLFHDCSPEIANWALTTLRLFYPKRAVDEPFSLKAWPDVPSNYICCRHDRTLNAHWWGSAARRRLKTKPIDFDSGHCPHVSRPAELADVLSKLATS